MTREINWMKLRIVYFLISTVVIGVGMYSLITWGLPLGVDFKGGSVIEYSFEKSISTEDARKKLAEVDAPVDTIKSAGKNNTYIFRFGDIEQEKREKIIATLKDLSKGDVHEERFERVGPSFGPELIRKTLYAIGIAAGAILLWVAYQFRSVTFGVSAILATFHDTFVLIGLFSLLGHIYGAEVDFLFVTAVLTTLSFSVHDTIVVYDRIREIRKKHGGNISEVANRAVGETMRRSINNSLTIIFMLVSLAILGGSTIRWFAVALLIGTISGTYSSPFVAVPTLVTWEQLKRKINRK